MHTNIQKLNLITDKVNEIIRQKQLKSIPKIIVVSKTFPLNKIVPLLESGHIHFGENKIQEAEHKWSNVQKQYANLKLHMIGNLQSNKAKKAVQIFDYIHSLDSIKLASKIIKYEKELKKKIKIFIQVNLSDESKKSGVLLKNLNNLYQYSTKELSLNIIGLMCSPPIQSNSQEYFKILRNAADKLNLKDLSMGMSSDFEQAIVNGSTYLRLGTIVLGKRDHIN